MTNQITKRLVPSSNWKAMRKAHSQPKKKATSNSTLPVAVKKAKVVKSTPKTTFVEAPLPVVATKPTPSVPKTEEIASTSSLSSEVSSQLAILSQIDSFLFTESDLSTTEDTTAKLGRYISLDCEMVKGIYTPSILARASIVNYNGSVLLDTFVAPSEPVEDYLTSVSGVTPDLLHGAPTFASVQIKIKELLSGRILIGHSVEKFDLAACGISHPPADVRDTSSYAPFRELYAKEMGGSRKRAPPLKWLAKHVLGRGDEFQGGQHSSVEDAKACMELYVSAKQRWEGDAVLKQRNDVSDVMERALKAC